MLHMTGDAHAVQRVASVPSLVKRRAINAVPVSIRTWRPSFRALPVSRVPSTAYKVQLRAISVFHALRANFRARAALRSVMRAKHAQAARSAAYAAEQAVVSA